MPRHGGGYKSVQRCGAFFGRLGHEEVTPRPPFSGSATPIRFWATPRLASGYRPALDVRSTVKVFDLRSLRAIKLSRIPLYAASRLE